MIGLIIPICGALIIFLAALYLSGKDGKTLFLIICLIAGSCLIFTVVGNNVRTEKNQVEIEETDKGILALIKKQEKINEDIHKDILYLAEKHKPHVMYKVPTNISKRKDRAKRKHQLSNQ